eukprot:Phypoly_transcript_15275.p1 GENE.Phypoly_transcript_15275~~Phypoly_transcript_15275.p1  ORF type:complete len:245 (-),score=56.81 Phypoly_transcript_15275:77-811(-)
MPKSKRHTRVALSVVKKKNKVEHKQKHYGLIQESLDKHNTLFVLKPHNMRNAQLKQLRDRFISSDFFIGKNTTMARALGVNPASEYKNNLHKMSKLLHGERILLITSDDKDDILDYFKTQKVVDYARGGFVPIENITRHPGPIELSHSLEPHLRALGMPTRLKNGVIHLENEYVLCTAGKAITPEQAKLLKLLEIKLAEFYIDVVGIWTEDGTTTFFEEEEEEEGEEEGEGGDMEDDEEEEDDE